MIVEPVEVIPDIASKKASVKLRLSWENVNGSAANVVKTIQLIVVRIKAWRTDNEAPPALLVNDSDTPIKRVTPEPTAKICQSGLPAIISAIAGITITTAKVESNKPSIRNIGRKSNNTKNPIDSFFKYYNPFQ